MIGAEATSGRFEVISRIAAGGMGEVYRARMSSGGGATKQVALKVVLDELADDPHYAQMLIDEAKVAMSLSHANVVQAFDAGRLGQRFFLAMELVDGATVRQVLRREGGPIPTAQSVTIAVEALKGLDYAHRFRDPDSGEALSIVHRDVSPSNLLVSREGEVKVADFGIAQSTKVEEEEGLVRGKVAYMAPEQVRAEALDRRTDVYAMGVVMYEMLTGARPFGAYTGPEMIAAVASGTFEPPRTHRPELDPELERITLRAMSARPEDRFTSAAAMRQELERWALDSGVLLSTSDLADYLGDLASDEPEDATASVPPSPTLAEGTILSRSRGAEDGVSVLRPEFDLGAKLNEALDLGGPVTAETRAQDAPPPASAPPASATEAAKPTRSSAAGLIAAAVIALFVVTGAALALWLPADAEPDAPQTTVAGAATPEPPDDIEPPDGIDPPAELAPLPSVGASADPPNETDPNAADPNETDPNETDPNETDPNETDPNETDPNETGASETEATGAEPTETGGTETQPAATGAAEATPSARRRRRREATPAAAGTARVSIASDPWAAVTMDGRSVGRTTIRSLEVPAGRHTFVLQNAPAGLTHRFSVSLSPGEERRFSIDLRNP